MEAEAEYISKVANSSINLIGIIVLVIGIAELNHLKTKQENLNTSDLDMLLLKFTSFFSFVYMTFTIITGCFCSHIKDFPNEVHLINGVCEMFQIFLQLVMNLEKFSSNQCLTNLGLCLSQCFISSLKNKEWVGVVTPNSREIMPGRQITIFLFLFNLAQWIVFTFEIQKVRASKVEECK